MRTAPIHKRSRKPVPGVLLLLTVGLGCGRSSHLPPAPPPESSAAETQPESQHAGAARRLLSTDIVFHDVAEDCGIDFSYRNGETAGRYSILETLGGGVAAFDFDCDGTLDLFFPGGGSFGPQGTPQGLPGALYRGDAGLKFGRVTTAAQLGEPRHYSHGAAVADYDADGFPDLLVTGYGGLVLYHNMGDGTFEESTSDSGLINDELWSTSAGWGDVTGDGYLDVYVAHYVDWSPANDPVCYVPGTQVRDVCPPRPFRGLPHACYVSNGDGTFRDATIELGLVPRDGDELGKGLGVVLTDLDLDGDLDIYVGNDTTPNFLFRNTGGRFEEVGMLSGTALSDTAVADGSMGVDIGDFNLDGLPDIWVANFEREAFALYQNEGDCLFRHVSRQAGITAVGGVYVGFGTVLFDADVDGDEDIVAVNGHVVHKPTNAPVRQLPLLFENLSGKRMINVAAAVPGYFSSAHRGRGLATGDFDGDGDVDMAVSHLNEPAGVLINDAPPDRHWLAIRLIGKRSPRTPVGATIQLQTRGGRQMRQVKGGASYLSTSDSAVHFGLGDVNEIEQVDIAWPSGVTQALGPTAPDRLITIVEP